MSLITIILVAISLSMDAFSLSLAYGTLNLNNRKINQLSCIVGIYHFFMPLIGMIIGNNIINFLHLNPNIVIFLVLVFIGLEMIIETNKKETILALTNLLSLFIFGLAVSLDSFSVGIGLKAIFKYPLISVTLFSICSAFFTYLGLKIGEKVTLKLGKISTKIGGLTLILIAITYLI
ncbi:MAG: manganese efflux pump MntP family protein [Bacilli bacterium]